MDSTGIREIAEMSKPNIVENNGYSYTDKDLEVIELPKVSTIKVSTLSSLVKLLKLEKFAFVSPILVQIENPVRIFVHCGINDADRNRECPYIAEFCPVGFDFGRWMSYEQMMIALKSKFVETPELLEVVKLLGTITEENNMKIEDDGFTQTVTVKKGIALKDNKVINPRVTLIPYSTFNEVEQPKREFLLRLNGCGEVALFEADGGAWKLEACESIANYLKENLKGTSDVYVVR